MGVNGCGCRADPSGTRAQPQLGCACDHIVFVLVGADACKCEIFIYSRIADKGYFRDEY